jgi:hypothetical protein
LADYIADRTREYLHSQAPLPENYDSEALDSRVRELEIYLMEEEGIEEADILDLRLSLRRLIEEFYRTIPR